MIEYFHSPLHLFYIWLAMVYISTGATYPILDSGVGHVIHRVTLVSKRIGVGVFLFVVLFWPLVRPLMHFAYWVAHRK